MKLDGGGGLGIEKLGADDSGGENGCAKAATGVAECDDPANGDGRKATKVGEGARANPPGSRYIAVGSHS